jgi:hypothetical protein
VPTFRIILILTTLWSFLWKLLYIQIHFSAYSVLARAEDKSREQDYCNSKSKVVELANPDEDMLASLKTDILYTLST